MGILIALAVIALLLGGFLILTALEAKHGARFLERTRGALDERVASVSAAVRHPGFRATVTEGLQDIAAHGVHEVVHGFLVLVRGVERMLTRLVRSIRARQSKQTSTAEVE